ncbi:MAG: ACP S-malonyltransferase [Verrucomicrobiota bacterium JB022]|nr:ACP S-malonyltransferase [Verrucomicrobiota bacterium JB022]
MITARIAHLFPGQGSQQKGMGADLFDAFPREVAIADEVLGYSIRELCLEDPRRELGQTQFTQPALFVVSALNYLARRGKGEPAPEVVAGHSLGEYTALFAADVFDFRTGVELTQRRGRLMAAASGGGMAAIVGLDAERVQAILSEEGLDALDLANLNSPDQAVISGPREAIATAEAPFSRAGARYIPLRVSAPFHSRYMEPARLEFADFLATKELREPRIPVIANRTARPYESGQLAETLAGQITDRVRWTETVQVLMGLGVEQFEEVGPGNVLTGLVGKIRRHAPPIVLTSPKPVIRPTPSSALARVNGLQPEQLGSAEFRSAYGCRLAYVAGAMYKGIASVALVSRMARAGLLSFFGAGGVDFSTLEQTIQTLQRDLGPNRPWGVNLICHPDHPALEEQTVDLLLRHGVRRVEAAAFFQITPALARYRLQGITRGADGKVVVPNRVLAKVSRPEVAEAFTSPVPEKLLERLRASGVITAEQAELARRIPVADDLCAEADSGGHTDMGSPYALLPAIQAVRDAAMARHRYPQAIRVGAAGGIGTPQAAAAAFVLGADFVLTGSINQCTPEAGTSDAVKDLLQTLNVQDTAYAPAGDMFELGAKVQVVKKSLFFPARANKLHDLYRHYDSLDDLPPKLREQIQERFFRRSFDEVWEETRAYYARSRPDALTRAEANPKQKMALIFRWYFIHSMRLALCGDTSQRVDYQIHCGPALGAFNQWAKGTELEHWRQRHVDVIGQRLMEATAELLTQRMASWSQPPATHSTPPEYR